MLTWKEIELFMIFTIIYIPISTTNQKEAVDHLLHLDMFTKIEHLLMTCISYIDVTRMHVLHEVGFMWACLDNVKTLWVRIDLEGLMPFASDLRFLRLLDI